MTQRGAVRGALRIPAVWCLAIWAAVWTVFLAMRFSPFDYRVVPGIGPILLVALATTFMAPLLATFLACVALIKKTRTRLDWLVLGCSIVVLGGQWLVFAVTRWM